MAVVSYSSLCASQRIRIRTHGTEVTSIHTLEDTITAFQCSISYSELVLHALGKLT